MAVGSFSSGQLLARFGWSTVNEVIFPLVAIAAVALVWHARRENRVAAAQ